MGLGVYVVLEKSGVRRGRMRRGWVLEKLEGE